MDSKTNARDTQEIEAKRLGVPVKEQVDLEDGTTKELRLIPEGTLETGEHLAKVGSFYAAVTPTTQAQYERTMKKNPSWFKGPELPVENVSWEAAVEYCATLTKKTGKPFRLPTEAEWEYACRAGTGTLFNVGMSLGPDQANFDDSATLGPGRMPLFGDMTKPVGSYPPNAWGLYDMHGNISTWTLDWYGPYPDPEVPVTDAYGPATGNMKVLRGGSWFDKPYVCRSAFRDAAPPSYTSFTIGFRVVMLLQ